MAIDEAAREVREFGQVSSLAAVQRLLELIERQHMEALRTVAPQDLQYRQGCLAQAVALRLLLQGELHTNGCA